MSSYTCPITQQTVEITTPITCTDKGVYLLVWRLVSAARLSPHMWESVVRGNIAPSSTGMPAAWVLLPSQVKLIQPNQWVGTSTCQATSPTATWSCCQWKRSVNQHKLSFKCLSQNNMYLFAKLSSNRQIQLNLNLVSLIFYSLLSLA